MSHSIASTLCAGILLSAGAFAAESDDAPAASAPHAKAAPAAASVHNVFVFVTLRDAAGKLVAKPSVRVEGENAVDIGVGPAGAKMSLPTKQPESVRVLFPGGNCSIALTPKATASGRVTIVVDQLEEGPRCAVAEPAADGKPASAPASSSGKAKHDSGLFGSIF